jgi:hypothetical protein
MARTGPSGSSELFLLTALYPAGSEEKRLLEAMLPAAPNEL